MKQFYVTIFICKLGEARTVQALGKDRNDALIHAQFLLGLRDGYGFNVLEIA